MQIAMVGLGRMGANMTRRLMRGGHEVVVFDRKASTVGELATEGAAGSASLEELVRQMTPPRAVWIMVPAGDPTEETITALANVLEPSDTIIDGGNTHYKDDVRRAKTLAGKSLTYIDVGTSGGIRGLERGYCLMIGGDRAAVERLEPIFRTLAPGRGDISETPGRKDRAGHADEGFLYCGPAGAGHFVKMVHNGIEYGLMQAYAEGFDLLHNAGSADADAEHRYDLPVADIAEVWRRGSVVSSWLLDLTAAALARDGELHGYRGHVADSGEGRWTVEAAVERAVPAVVLSAALYQRFRSRVEASYADKLLSAMREQFGGHVERSSRG